MKQDSNIYQDDYEPEDGVSAKDVASLRWMAVEAFNTAPGLSPMARRLGIALITTMDAKTRACFPSEERLRAALGVHIMSIRAAKAELRDGIKGKHDGGLINWTNPGGPRHLSRYTFNWSKLIRLSRAASHEANAAMQKRKATQRNGSETTTYKRRSNGSETTTYETLPKPREDASKVVNSLSIGSDFIAQGSETTHAVVVNSLPELSQELTQQDTAQHEHDTASGVGPRCAEDAAEVQDPSSKTDQAEAKGARDDTKGQPPRKLVCHFDALKREFGSDLETFHALCSLPRDRQARAHLALKNRGIEAALDIINGRTDSFA